MVYHEIEVCPDNGSNGDVKYEIEVCPDDGSNGDVKYEIEVCPDDGTANENQEPPLPGPCDNATPVVISGTDEPSVGVKYLAGGGVGPYQWSISAGSISSTGEITSLSGACGSGTVSVTDACGSSDSIQVRFPSGQWVNQSDTGAIDPARNINSCCSWGGSENPCNTVVVEVHGQYRYSESWTEYTVINGCTPECEVNCYLYANTSPPAGCPAEWMCITRRVIDTWECP